MPKKNKRAALASRAMQCAYGTPDAKEATEAKRNATLAANKVRPSPLLLETL